MNIDLTQALRGEKYRVGGIQAGRLLTRKLDSLGIRPGVEIVKKSSQLIRGPVIAQVCRTRVAIGFGMAQKIMVVPVKPETR